MTPANPRDNIRRDIFSVKHWDHAIGAWCHGYMSKDREWGQHDAPTCDQCQLIATHYNGRTGEVYEWTTQAEHRQACENLQNAMDDAFDNTYFSGGW